MIEGSEWAGTSACVGADENNFFVVSTEGRA